jgi:lipopolysaccharide transport system permease protein
MPEVTSSSESLDAPIAPPAVLTPPSPVPVLEIGPPQGWLPIDFRELWNYRELLVFLAMRDIKVRYKQTVLGAAWAIIQPFMTMIVFSVFFGRLAGIKADNDIPYPVFTYCALLPWQLFSYALTQSSTSLLSEQHLITKVYFPRLIIPFSSICASLLDFAIAFVVLIAMLLYYGITPGWQVVTLPALVLLTVATALSMGLWLSALTVRYRDLRYTIPFLTQFWLFVTPVAYPASLVPEKWRALYGLNPMAGVVEGFRWALLPNAQPPGSMMWVSVAAVVVLLIGGAFYFRRVEDSFADVV